MASSWLTSWLSSWGDSWGAATPTPTPSPAQTGGAGYFVDGEIKRKKRKDSLREDIAKAEEELSRVETEISDEKEVIAEAVERVELNAPPVTPRLDHLYQQQLDASLKLQQLRTLLWQLERQRDEDDIEILLLSIQ